jgi:hypothetical protein
MPRRERTNDDLADARSQLRCYAKCRARAAGLSDDDDEDDELELHGGEDDRRDMDSRHALQELRDLFDLLDTLRRLTI